MTIRCYPVLVLALFSALALMARAQDAEDAQIIEEDYRVTTVEGRQRQVANLLSRFDELHKSGQVIEAVRTLNRVGRFQIRMFVAQEAVTTFQKALQLLEEQPDVKTHIDSLNGLASSYDYLSKCDLAEPIASQAITLSKQSNYVAGHAEALLILSDCQNHRDHALALKGAQESLELWRSIDRKRGIAEAHFVIGHYQMAQNNLVESGESLEAARSLYRELGAMDEQASILIYLGIMEYKKGAWQNSLAFYREAQSMIDEKAEPYKMGQIAFGLGEGFLESGLPDVALVKFREALEYFKITKNARAVTASNWSIGRAQYWSTQYHEALESLQLARNDAKSSKDLTLTAFCDDFLGRTYYALNDPAAALSHFQSAFDGYSKAKNTMEVLRTQALIGQVYQQQGKLYKARDIYRVALKGFRGLGDRVNESATLYAMGCLELQEDNLNAAADYLQQSIEVTEQMRRSSTSSDLTAAFSATVHERYERYIECLMRKHETQPEQGFALKAFETIELARARSLTELLRATQTNLVPGLDPELAEQEKSLRQSLRVKEDYKVTLLGKAYKKEELDALESELAGLETKYKQIIQTIRERYPSYDQISRPSSWGLKKIQDEVIADDQTVLLEYSLGAEQSHVWAVTRNDIKAYELAAQAQINDAAQKVYQLTISAAGKRGDELNKAIRELSELVLSPVAAQLNKRRIIVVADGTLHYIPFQILPVSSDKEEPLVVTTEIINAPSASILGQLIQERARRQPPTNTLVAFGDPVFASNYAQRKESSGNEYVVASHLAEIAPWRQGLRNIEQTGDSLQPESIQPLFYAERELANLEQVAGPRTFVAAGFNATREELKNTDLTKYSILHFATHGILDPKRPENSGLFLSMVNREGREQNGFLDLQDIYSLHAPVDLVVLSACRTGLGKDVRGEGLIGLTRGFMYAGASSVVSSLWKVDDEATGELMKRFYTNMLQDGMPAAAALRAAQNSIREQPQWRSPYYWAAFTFQGDYRHVIKPPTSESTINYVRIILLGGMLALMGVFVWWWYLRRLRMKATT